MRMKVSELRLRNLVSNKKGDIYYVSNLSLDIDDEYNELIGGTPLGRTTNEKLKEERELYWMPIPLTEEWLLKFGFDATFHGYKHPRFLFSLWQNGYDGEDPKSFIVQYNKTEERITNIKYVHQLQNLYFALTGEELTIKELA